MLQSGRALPLPDGVEDEVVAFSPSSEVLFGVVDHRHRAQRSRQLQVRGAAHPGHLRTEVISELHEPGAGAISGRDDGGRLHQRGLHCSGRTLRPHLRRRREEEERGRTAALRQGIGPRSKHLSVDDGRPKLLVEDLVLLGSWLEQARSDL